MTTVVRIVVFVLCCLMLAFFVWALGQTTMLDEARDDIHALQEAVADLRADHAETHARIDSLGVAEVPTEAAQRHQERLTSLPGSTGIPPALTESQEANPGSSATPTHINRAHAERYGRHAATQLDPTRKETA